MTIQHRHPAAWLACILMAAAAVIRILHYLPAESSQFFTVTQIYLPIAANLTFIIGILLAGRYWKTLSMTAVVLGILFFLIKASNFTPLHKLLCTILYLTVLTLYILTVTAVIPTKKLLYPLFGLPFLYHLLIEDTQFYFFADPPVPVWDWMPEISVLCIMAALFVQTFAIRETK